MRRRSTSNKKKIEKKSEEHRYYSQSQSEQQQTGRPVFYDYINLKKQANKSKFTNKPNNNQEYLKMVDPLNYKNYQMEQSLKYKNLKSDFPDQQKEITKIKKWIQSDQNICIYGFGSKIKLLQRLWEECFSDDAVFWIRGYIAPPKMRVKVIYTLFGDYLIKLKLVRDIKSHSIKDQLQQYRSIISQKLRDSQIERIVVLFNSIDGPGLLDEESQRQLAQLFSIPRIHLVASLDNMKTVMNWSPLTFQKFDFRFFCVNTGHYYLKQHVHRPNNNEKQEKSETAFAFIWQSLSKNQKQILKYFATNQLNNIEKNIQSNYTLCDLLDICIQNMILSDDSQLRENLVELIDHNVIKQRFDEQKNRKVYVMKFDKELLQKVVNDRIGQNAPKTF